MITKITPGTRHSVALTVRDGRRAVIRMPGRQGAAGVSPRFDFTQASASSTWTINHNLGKRPEIAVYSPGGVHVFAEIIHTSDNQAQVLFSAPYSGTAVCLA